METSTLILIGLLVAAGFYIMVVYNGLVRGRNQIENAWGQIDVQLKRRYDLIPNLVEVVKDYMGYEQETLQQVIEARGKALAAHDGPRDASIAAERELGGSLGRLLAVFEQYPDLKANQNVQDLTEELTSTENRIGFARQHYNDSVMVQNNQVEQFPANLIAGPFGFSKQDYFEVEEAEREAISVDLR